MKHHPMLRLFLFLIMLLYASLASSQSLPQMGKVQFEDELRVLWRFDTGG